MSELDQSAAAGDLPCCSVVILAGGNSQRLGRDKSLLRIHGQPLISLTVAKLANLSDDLVVVTNHSERYEALSLPVRFVADERRGVGALMGVYSGLKAARHPRALAVACDMPFLNLSLLRYMLPRAEGYDVMIPCLGGYLEPLHAIYDKACLSPMLQLLEQGCRQIIAFFHEVRVRHVEGQEIEKIDPQHLSFVNVNTPEDWERVQALLAQE